MNAKSDEAAILKPEAQVASGTIPFVMAERRHRRSPHHSGRYADPRPRVHRTVDELLSRLKERRPAPSNVLGADGARVIDVVQSAVGDACRGMFLE